MNTARKITLTTYAVGMLVACLFLPWVGGRVIISEGVEWPEYFLGYAPVWSPPDASRVDLPTVCVELAGLTFLAGLAFVMAGLGGRRRSRGGNAGADWEQALRSTFWGQWTLLSLSRTGVVGAKAVAPSAARKRQDAENTLISLVVVSFTLFCIQITFYFLSHTSDSHWVSGAFLFLFGGAFVLFSGYYAITMYMSFCEMEKGFWTPLAIVNLMLCLLNWYLPRAAVRLAVIPSPQDLGVWIACTLFFSCGVFVRLNGR